MKNLDDETSHGDSVTSQPLTGDVTKLFPTCDQADEASFKMAMGWIDQNSR